MNYFSALKFSWDIPLRHICLELESSSQIPDDPEIPDVNLDTFLYKQQQKVNTLSHNGNLQQFQLKSECSKLYVHG